MMEDFNEDMRLGLDEESRKILGYPSSKIQEATEYLKREILANDIMLKK